MPDRPLVTCYTETDKTWMWDTLYDTMSLFACWYWSGAVCLCFVVWQWLWIRAARGWELPACILVQSLYCVQKLQPGPKLLQQHRVRTCWFTDNSYSYHIMLYTGHSGGLLIWQKKKSFGGFVLDAQTGFYTVNTTIRVSCPRTL